MLRPFHKMHGLGNDFVVIDARACRWRSTTPLARAIADRHTGIGCDQLILLEPSAEADVRMRIFNHDGSEVGACGNAARCVVLLTGPTRIETDGGIIDGGEHGRRGRGHDGRAALRLGRDPARLSRWTPLRCRWRGTRSKARWRSMSAIRTWCSSSMTSSAVPLDELGPRIEHDPAFPERINVNVAAVEGDGIALAHLGARRRPDPGLRHRRLRHRGRGDRHRSACTSPVQVTMPGGALTIGWVPGSPILMRGPATHVFDGEIDLEALRP